jgi:hypothetical protein
MALDDRFKGSLYQGVEKPSLLSRVGTALQGFGAGYQGRGQEFLANLERKRQREQDELMQASISDAKEIKRLLRDKRDTPYRQGMYDNPIGSTVQAYNQEGIKESVDILNDRISLLRQRGQDDSDTFRIRDRILQGDISGADAEIDNFLRQAKGAGYQTEEFMENVVTLPDGRMGQVMANGTINYLDNEPYRAPVTAGSAEGKIYQDYQSGVFGRVGTAEAMAARDAAIAQIQYKEPITYQDQFGVTRFLDGEALDPSMSTTEMPTTSVQPPQQTAQDSANTMQFSPDGMPIDTIQAPIEPQTTERIDLERFVPPEEVGIVLDPQYPNEPYNQFRDREREHQKTVIEYNRTEQQRVDSVRAENDIARKNKNRAIRAYSAAANFLANPRAHQVTGPIQGKEGFGLLSFAEKSRLGFYPDYIDAKADFETLADILTSENLDMMSGVLSESDINLIARAQADLRTNQSDARAKAAVEDIVTAYNNYFDELVKRDVMTLDERNAIDANLRQFETSNENSTRAVNERFQLQVDEPPTSRLVD